MGLLSPSDWQAAEAIAGIGYCNPFLPERIELERRALGRRHIRVGPVIRPRPGSGVDAIFPNLRAIHERSRVLVEAIRDRLADGVTATPAELVVYEDLALYVLYGRFMNALDGLVSRSMDRADQGRPVLFWSEFEAEFRRLLHPPGRDLPSRHDPAVVFAGFYQIERAFTQIFRQIVGGSMPAARLRASAWQSIFTHDMRRYARTLHRRMADFPTLVIGPSGSGKELVARAIGCSCFLPFDPVTRTFPAGDSGRYVPLNLAALSSTLIESELFGHVKGAFTTALADRAGWLERCGAHGAVFLDEIGELDGSIQVKLLRALEARQFERVGSTEPIAFRGKIIAATNRDLAAEIRAGRFRPDLYYRLCADQVTTPSLAEQLADDSDDLPELVRFIVRGILVEPPTAPHPSDLSPVEDDALEGQIEQLTAEVVDWIDATLGRSYPWPGNFRELGQCVRNVMIRGEYRPNPIARDPLDSSGPLAELLDHVRHATLSKDSLLGRYFALAYHRSGESFAAAGRLLGIDHRIVRKRIDLAYLERLRDAASPLRRHARPSE